MNAMERALEEIERLGKLHQTHKAQLMDIGERARQLLLEGRSPEEVRQCYRTAVGNLYHEAGCTPYWENRRAKEA